MPRHIGAYSWRRHCRRERIHLCSSSFLSQGRGSIVEEGWEVGGAAAGEVACRWVVEGGSIILGFKVVRVGMVP